MDMSQSNWNQLESDLQQTIAELEQQKKASRVKVLIFGTIIMALFLMVFHRLGPIAILFGMLFGYGLVYLIYRNEHNKIYKAKVVPKLVDAICPGATYSSHGTLNIEMIKTSRLYNVGWGEKFRNEDTIRGKVDKTDFIYGEVTLSHTESNGKQSREVIDFRGFVFEADFNKHFQGITIVSSQRHALTGNVGGLFSSLNRCHLEDVNFENRYKSYTTNDQEARYILSPALQQRILSMNDTFQSQLGDKELSISFHDGRMLIMVPSHKNRFEVKYDMEGVKQDFLALTVFIDIVNQLNLNLRIWTKE